MKNIKEIIKNNLIKYRKNNKLTQLELAEKIHYSDKAISRWENGEVVPDIETLNLLSEIYEIPINQFFEEHTMIKPILHKIKHLEIGNKLAISLISVAGVWLIACILYFYLHTLSHSNVWQLFMWAVPVSAIVGIVFNGIWGRRLWTFILVSILVWSILSSFYFQFFKYNLFFIFLIGSPLQVSIILWSFISPKNKTHK